MFRLPNELLFVTASGVETAETGWSISLAEGVVGFSQLQKFPPIDFDGLRLPRVLVPSSLLGHEELHHAALNVTGQRRQRRRRDDFLRLRLF